MPESSSAGGKLPVARIGRPRGNRGDVVLHEHFDLKQEDLVGVEAAARFPDGKELLLRIQRVWWHGSRAICHFEGCSSISDAKKLTGAELFVERGQLAPLDEDEYFVADLIGCSAFHKDGSELGIVTKVDQVGDGANIQIAGEAEMLVPLARTIVVEVDLENRRIVIDPPDGLLEINED